MADRDRALGGYDPQAGLGAHRAAHEAGQPQLNPVPSLLRSLLSDHLDPGYAAAAAERGGRPRQPRWAGWIWQALAALLIAALFAAAVAQARSTAPGVKQTQEVLANGVRASQTDARALAARRATLRTEVDDLRRSRLTGDAEGQRVLRLLDGLGVSAAAMAVTGPGLVVTLTDPGLSPDLTDLSKERIPGSRQVILDRDLQLVVNSLWVSGAEAIAVGDVRIGPNVTIRQAGGAILVDNQAVASPYTISAIGPSRAMRDTFDASPGLQRMRLLETAYGIGATVTESSSLTLPTGSTREVKYAKPIGMP